MDQQVKSGADSADERASAAAWYGLGVLFVAYTFSFVDRSILSLLVEPIKQSLGLSDTQVSLLHGLAFALFYTFLGIPIARLADSRSRRTIIATGILVWSLMTAACGLAGRFVTLFLARVGVGVGEAALSPAAFSMLTDLFPKRQLGLAMGLYSMGVQVGSGLAFIIGGIAVGMALEMGSIDMPLIGTLAPWQTIFFIVGLPGLVVAAVMLTVQEPARKAQPKLPGDESWLAVFRFIGKEPGTFILHFLGFAALGLLFNGFIAWTPSFFIRTFGMTPGTAGPLLGSLILVLGSAGIVAGGAYSDRLFKSGRTAAPIISARLAAIVLIPLSIAAPLMPSFYLCAALFAVFFFFAAFPYGCAAAAIQMAAPPHLRAQMSAIYLFFLNMIGTGFGPTAIALTTDYALGDARQLGVSMAIIGGLSALLGAFILDRCTAPFAGSVNRRAHE
ncbi:MAG: MFS transporter [Pseudomonadota bacterium]